MKLHITPEEEKYYRDTPLATYSKEEFYNSPSDYKRMVNYYNNLYRIYSRMKQSKTRRRLEVEAARIRVWMEKNRNLKEAV